MEQRKIFLDIGGYEGQSISRFAKEVPDFATWKIYSFEPHPETYKRLVSNVENVLKLSENINLLNVAITGFGPDKRKLFLGKKNDGEGSTLTKGKTTGKVDYKNPVEVTALKLADFMEKELLPTDHIVLKMNIEGGEYEIMEHILAKGLIGRFHQIYVQLHRDKLDPKNKKIISQLEDKFFYAASQKDVDVFYSETGWISFQENTGPQTEKPMKVAHFVEFGPNKCGLYGTAKDLITAERGVGIDAALIDTQLKKGKITNRTNIRDGNLKICGFDWALKADIFVHHSILPKQFKEMGTPIVMAMHGRPESTFLLEHRRIMSIFTLSADRKDSELYSAYITFWKDYMFHLSTMVPADKLFCVPAMVNLERYNPLEKPHKYKPFGKPNILVADMWRQDVTPYNVIMAAARFRDKYAPRARIHIVGAAPKKSSVKTLLRTLNGAVGEVHPLISNIEKCYRGADMVITPHNIATRIVRETLACGTPIVAGSGSPYTPFTADARDTEAFADAINDCWKYIQNTDKREVIGTARRTAEDNFNLADSGAKIKEIFEKILKDDMASWMMQDGFKRKKYLDYDSYIRHQKNKAVVGTNGQKKYDMTLRKELAARLGKVPFIKQGKSVLCLGARAGGEVQAFRDVGCFAVGIDLKPAPDSQYVLKGDFHTLDYHDSSVDMVYVNCIDHVYRIRRFIRNIKRVLKPNGYLIIEAAPKKAIENDNWACLQWEDCDDLINVFQEYSFDLVNLARIKGMAFERQICLINKEDG